MDGARPVRVSIGLEYRLRPSRRAVHCQSPIGRPPRNRPPTVGPFPCMQAPRTLSEAAYAGGTAVLARHRFAAAKNVPFLPEKDNQRG